MDLEVTVATARHENGTKFYTAILFESKKPEPDFKGVWDWEATSNRAVLLKIHGKVGASGGGRVIKEEYRSKSEAEEQFESITRVKTGRGYKFDFTTLSGSLKGLIEIFSQNKGDLEKLADLSRTSFGDYKSHLVEAVNFIGTGGETESPFEPSEKPDKPKRRAAPKPEPVRDETWGSW